GGHMAYSTSNPPMLVSQTPAGTYRVFSYLSTNAVGATDATGFFTDGYARGMRIGDRVNVQVGTSTAVTDAADMYVSAASSTGVTITGAST
ncbi:MAG: hypothetical protein P8Y45_04795, partial [Exilibacterium sp.]